jgi:hypothetical protein
MNQQREFNPQAFHVFGPKIVAMRGSYDDKGLFAAICGSSETRASDTGCNSMTCPLWLWRTGSQ